MQVFNQKYRRWLSSLAVMLSVHFHRHPQDLLLLDIDGRLYLSAHVSHVNTVDNNCGKAERREILKMKSAQIFTCKI